jgi:anti-sigma28 factor (negative regulator of flagellin synthesis)
MILTKYRMIVGEGYVETLDEQQAIESGNYIVVTEEIPDEVTEENNG